MRLFITAACVTLVLASGAAYANTWDKIPLISSTLGDMPNRLCVGAPDPAHQHDIGCPIYSPYVTSGGLLGVGTSSPTATLQVSGSFVVSTSAAPTSPSLYVGTDGNVGIGTTSPAAKLHVGTGTLGVVEDGAGGNFTPQVYNSQTSGTAGVGVEVNDGTNNRRAALFVDQTYGLWGLTSKYSTGGPPFVIRLNGLEALRIDNSGNVGIGTTNPNANLEVSGTVSATHFVGDGSGLTGVGSADRITSGTTAVTVNSATSTISFTTNGSVANYVDSGGRLVTTGISVTTNQLSATTGYFSGNVGVGTSAPIGQLEISKTLTGTAAGPVTEFTSSYLGTTLYSDPAVLSYVTAQPSANDNTSTVKSALTGRLNIPASSANVTFNPTGVEGVITNASSAANNGNAGCAGFAWLGIQLRKLKTACPLHPGKIASCRSVSS